MSAQLYDSCVGIYARGLAGLSLVMRKSADHAKVNGFSANDFTGARLHESMFPLYRQVQIACEFALKTAPRVLGREAPITPEHEQKYEELQALVAQAHDALQAYTPAEFDGRAAVVISVPVGVNVRQFPAGQYAVGIAMPNFFFHYVTAYGILRSRGVDLGKNNYFGVP